MFSQLHRMQVITWMDADTSSWLLRNETSQKQNWNFVFIPNFSMSRTEQAQVVQEQPANFGSDQRPVLKALLFCSTTSFFNMKILGLCSHLATVGSCTTCTFHQSKEDQQSRHLDEVHLQYLYLSFVQSTILGGLQQIMKDSNEQTTQNQSTDRVRCHKKHDFKSGAIHKA